MTRHLRSGWLLSALVAGSVALILGFAAGRATAAPRSALESSPVEEAGFRAAQGPSEVPLNGSGVPGSARPRPAGSASEGGSSSPTPSGVGETDIGTALESGIASYVSASYGARYLALPEGPGVRVTICHEARCVARTSSDAGPDRAMQRAGRVADVSYADFAYLCDCSPPSVGLIQVTVERGGPSVTPPATDR